MTATEQLTVTYKTKIKRTATDNAEYFTPKAAISTHDVTTTPRHALCNSVVFPLLLNKAHKAAFNGSSVVRLALLPTNVTVNTDGFLATVTVTVSI